MGNHAPGWAVIINGSKIDLDDLRQQLQPPFEPWVEEWERCTAEYLARYPCGDAIPTRRPSCC